jgi:hypothetical protein
MYRSGLVDTLATHANTNGVWPNSLVRRPPWLHASSVKNKTKQVFNFDSFDMSLFCECAHNGFYTRLFGKNKCWWMGHCNIIFEMLVK